MITVRGEQYGTAAELAHRLGGDVTVAMVRTWANRYGLPKTRTIGEDGRPQVLFPLREAARIERDMRQAKAAGRRGRARRVDAGAV